MTNVIKLRREENANKYKIYDVEHLISELKKIMPIKKDVAILNINKYGYMKDMDYILESIGFNVNGKGKLKVDKNIIQQARLFNIIFNIDKNCFIRIRNKQTGEIRAYSTSTLQNEYRLQAILKSKYFTNMNDMMYSLNCFNNMYNATEESLFSIQNIALDVDFPTDKYTLKQALEIIKTMYKNNEILVPNIIEYGHRIRLIYSIEDVGIDKTTNKSLKLIKKVAEALNDKLPKALNSSVQPLTTFGRIIGSVNTKNNRKVKCEVINPNKYKLRDLQEKLLEPLKIKRNVKTIKKKDSAVIKLNNSYSLNLLRLKDFEKIQSIREYGYREYLCYLYRNYCLMSGDSKQLALKKVLEFNSKFVYPLTENQVKSDTKNLNGKTYNHKNSTILNKLNITPKEEINLNLETIISDVEYKRRENIRGKKNYQDKLKNQGKLTKKEQLKIIYDKIKSLRKKGYKNKDIALELSLQTKTLKGYITYMKKNGLL